MRSNPRRNAGKWVRAGLLVFGAISCQAVDKGGPGERVPWLVGRGAGPTRTGTNLTLLGLDVVKKEGTKEAAIIPSVVGWSETGWKTVGLSWIASTDVNNEASRFLAAGLAKELIEGKLTVGARGFSSESGNTTLLAAKLGLPRDTKFYYSVDPEVGEKSQQLALRHTQNWRGKVLDVVVRGDGGHLNPTIGAEHAWGRNALGLARDIENKVIHARFTRGLGDGIAQFSLFGEHSDHGSSAIGIGFQIGLDSVRRRKPRRTIRNKTMHLSPAQRKRQPNMHPFIRRMGGIKRR